MALLITVNDSYHQALQFCNAVQVLFMNIIIYRKVYVKDIYMVYRDKDRLLYMRILHMKIRMKLINN